MGQLRAVPRGHTLVQIEMMRIRRPLGYDWPMHWSTQKQRHKGTVPGAIVLEEVQVERELVCKCWACNVWAR